MLEIEIEGPDTPAGEKGPDGPSFATSLTREELEQVLGHLLERMWMGQDTSRPGPKETH
jgi:hypothetical protein